MTKPVGREDWWNQGCAGGFNLRDLPSLSLDRQRLVLRDDDLEEDATSLAYVETSLTGNWLAISQGAHHVCLTEDQVAQLLVFADLWLLNRDGEDYEDTVS